MPRRIFISHKVKDKVAVQKIRSALSLYGANELEIFISERIKAGVKWADKIWGNLKKADWLLLLYTDPSEEWDWCLFEAGFFAGIAKDSEGRLVCLHTGDVPPPMPLQGWQAVPVTDGNLMDDFLKDLFTGINDELINSPEMIRQLTERIAGAFSLEVRRKIKSDWQTKYVTIHMDADQLKELSTTGRVPGGALCGLKEQESLDVFGYGTEECTMSTIEQGLFENYKEMWLKSLGDALRAASENRRPIPRILSLFSERSQKDFHVILHCVNRFSDKSAEFYLLFVEKFPENEEEQGRRLRSLGNLLKLGRTFRWKVLKRYHRELTVLNQRMNVENEIKDCMVRIGWAMDWVIGESQRLNILTADDVLDTFIDEEVKRKLSYSLKTVWPDLFIATREGIENTDIDKVLAALAGMLQVNKEYMIFTAGRYQDLLKEMP